MKIGILFVGCFGSTASTFIAGFQTFKTNPYLINMGSYWGLMSNDINLLNHEFILGGWDHRFNDINHALQSNRILNIIVDAKKFSFFPSIIGPSDYAASVELEKITHLKKSDAINKIRKDIAYFKNSNKLDRVFVFNTSSPSPSPSKLNLDNESDIWCSNEAYSFASIQEGCDWVEFTPSDTITPNLIELALSNSCRIAGRDGSTGQTILKLQIKEFLLKRGFKLDNWYSTNLIGNHDGLVLQNSNYNELKFHDKASAINENQLSRFNHHIEINYCPAAGDNKESWDCIHFSGWLNTSMSLRVNWHGQDSHLASSLILDIIKSLIHAHNISQPFGLMTEIGLFFKNPLGCEIIEFEDLYCSFKNFAHKQI